jgi:glycosyltransferase involved in cell wall biosynthesis
MPSPGKLKTKTLIPMQVSNPETTILIVTPSFNSELTISRTILSVISQQGNFRLIYHIQDGGSTDATMEKCKQIKQLVDLRQIPVFCNDITFNLTSEKDEGMYDAIWKAFSIYNTKGDVWMFWINSDDMLRPGACALLAEIDAQHGSDWIKWVGGRTSIIDDNTGMQIGYGKRPHNRQAIQNGLCEGIHWDFIQQEGVSFRRTLWDSVDNIKGFREFKYAGDWNLWRMFAHKAEFFQVPWETGSFFRVKGQISHDLRYLYDAEICATLSTENRLENLMNMDPKQAFGYLINTNYETREIYVIKNDQSAILASWKNKTIRQIATKKKLQIQGKNIFNDRHHFSGAIEVVGTQDPAIIIHPEDWQYPAITEKHAAFKAASVLPERTGYCYFGFPWATLTDMIECVDPRRFNLLSRLGEYKEKLSRYEKVFTVCQHVLQYKYEKLLQWIGITDVFWSHHSTNSDKCFKYINVKPFPLYPLQVVLASKKESSNFVSREDPSTNDFLCSFAGARYCNGYLTRVRDWIIDNLQNRPHIKIVSRDAWHYQDLVYADQIESGLAEAHNKIEKVAGYNRNSEEYINIMKRSRFSLCPSGSGPNSIRLWEALLLKSVPVVLSDDYILPGPKELWDKAIISLPEDESSVIRVEEVLGSVDNFQIKDMHSAIDQLLLLYGPDTFVTDILIAWLDDQSEQTPATSLHTYSSLGDVNYMARINKILGLSVTAEKKRSALSIIIKSELRRNPASRESIAELINGPLSSFNLVLEPN